MINEDGRRRVVVEALSPEVDGGRFPVKRVAGEAVVATVDVFADGHDMVAGELLHAEEGETEWSRTPLVPLGNDRFTATFVPAKVGLARYAVEAWIDRFGTWAGDLAKRVGAGQDVAIDLEIGASLVAGAAKRAAGDDARLLTAAAKRLADGRTPAADRAEAALDPELAAAMARWPDRSRSTTTAERTVRVDPPLAGFSAWYELFPRSTSPEPGRHGTFRDVIARLPYVERMGFDVLYLPPIHPIGVAHRKGKNNRRTAERGDVGSPWAIGGAAGGHDAIHPDLGTPEDFRALVAAARERGIAVALDLALQCSPDHPWVKEHPEWFKHRPDGSIQYAENPPKKYEDIYPLDFESEDWRDLWEAIRAVVLHWIGEGVTVFRVDNPHTKSFPFWEWLIGEVKREHPETIFLAEAFTRPKVMYRLAKLGFTQSYTYFTWRERRHEFVEYLTELTRPPVADFFRPNFWPNTPDILPAHLQHGGRPAFLVRLLLAATLSPNYGIYGPAFELMEHVAREPGSEEYLDSEKYQLRAWDLDRPDGLAEYIALVNQVRRENPCFRSNRRLVFHPTDNDCLLVYSRASDDGENVAIVAANFDFHHTHAGWTNLDLAALGVPDGEPFEVVDQLTGAPYVWEGPRNYLELPPHSQPAHLFLLRRAVRKERDFPYFT